MRRPTLCRVSTLALAPEATRLGAKDTRKDRMVTDSKRDLETEETGLNLFDDSASAAGSFPHAMLGYDKHSVDSYVREVEAKVSQLKLQLRDSSREIQYVRSEVGTTDFTRLGAHATGLLKAAEAQAGDIVDRAEHEAERIKTEARRSAATLRESAQQEADDVRLTGLAGLRQLRQEQADAGASALEKARRDADMTVADAKQRANSIVEAANTKADALLETARVEAQRRVQEAERKASEVLATAQKTAEDSLAKSVATAKAAEDSITARLAQADKDAEEAAQRALEARKEADTIRAEAVRQAEETRLAATRESEDTLSTMRKRASQQEADLEERIAWRKEQLEREIASLEVRRVNAIGQLNNLRALAEESDQQFADEPTTVITRNEGQ